LFPACSAAICSPKRVSSAEAELDSATPLFLSANRCGGQDSKGLGKRKTIIR
jgi:hypothetical protein